MDSERRALTHARKVARATQGRSVTAVEDERGEE